MVNKKSWKKNFIFRFISAIFAFAVWAIIIAGPLQYKRQKSADDTQKLQFFDCFGPSIFYGLGTFTVMWWSCHLRVLIGPKEHLLLYNKMLVHRPTRKYNPSGTKEDHFNTPRTDWAALTNLSQATLMNTFTFAYRKGFLELRYCIICIIYVLFASLIVVLCRLTTW